MAHTQAHTKGSLGRFGCDRQRALLPTSNHEFFRTRESRGKLQTNAFVIAIVGCPENLVDAGMELGIGDLECVTLFLRYLRYRKRDGPADLCDLLQRQQEIFTGSRGPWRCL